jgi:hypothetical protein
MAASRRRSIFCSRQIPAASRPTRARKATAATTAKARATQPSQGATEKRLTIRFSRASPSPSIRSPNRPERNRPSQGARRFSPMGTTTPSAASMASKGSSVTWIEPPVTFGSSRR